MTATRPSGLSMRAPITTFNRGLITSSPRCSVEAWRDGICRGFCRLDVGPSEDDYIDCQNEFTLLHSIAVATPRGVSARFARTRDLLDDGCDDLVLISATRGKVRVTQKAQRLFASSGTTFSEFVLKQRLLLARRLLLHELGRHRKVSDIAYTVGFNNSRISIDRFGSYLALRRPTCRRSSNERNEFRQLSYSGIGQIGA